MLNILFILYLKVSISFLVIVSSITLSNNDVFLFPTTAILHCQNQVLCFCIHLHTLFPNNFPCVPCCNNSSTLMKQTSHWASLCTTTTNFTFIFPFLHDLGFMVHCYHFSVPFTKLAPGCLHQYISM